MQAEANTTCPPVCPTDAKPVCHIQLCISNNAHVQNLQYVISFSVYLECAIMEQLNCTTCESALAQLQFIVDNNSTEVLSDIKNHLTVIIMYFGFNLSKM